MNWLRMLFREGAAPGTMLRPAPESGATVLRAEPAAEQNVCEPPALPLAARLPEAYSIQRVLGQGGMGAVLLARHRDWDTDLVLKVPRPEILDDPSSAPRIRLEAEAWTSLGLHPHIVYCYFVLPVDEVPVLVIEYLKGGNLREYLAAGHGGDVRRMLDLSIQLCHGMEHAHKAGLVHRDIKPENILLDEDGTLKVTDFGISLIDGAARVRSGTPVDGGMTMAGLGTRGYMAPEQWVDAHKVDGRADIFAFGVCLYEMLCGARPYESTAGERRQAPEPLRSLPEPLRALMKQCVDWYRDARPATFSAVRERLVEVYRTEFGAESGFARLPQISPEADSWNNRGVSRLELGQPEEALVCFRRALETNPCHFEAARNQALLGWRRGEMDDVEVLLALDQLAVMPGADARQIALARAEVHQERFDPEEARKALAACPGLYEERFAGKEASCIRRVRSTSAHPAGLSATLAVSADGRRALTTNEHRIVKYWDLSKLECLSSIEDPARQVNCVAIGPGGRWGLLGWRESALECWDLMKCECVRHIGEPVAFRSVALGPDAVFALGMASGLKQWDLTTGECVLNLGDGQTAVACSADGRLAVSGGYDGRVSVWDLAEGKSLAVLTGHAKCVTTVAIRADGRCALTGSDDARVLIWDLAGRRLLGAFPEHDYPIRKLVVSADGSLAVSLAANSCLRIWDVAAARCIRTIRGSPTEYCAMDMDAAGTRVATIGGWGALSLFEVDLSRRFAAPLRPSRPVAFAALQERQRRRDATLAGVEAGLERGDLAGAHRDLIGAWESIGFAAHPQMERLHARLLALGRPVKPLAAHLLFSERDSGNVNGVVRVAMSESGKRAVSSNDKRPLRVWDLAKRSPVYNLPGGNLFTVDMSADGTVAVGAGSGKNISVWDTATGQLVREMESPASFVRSLALTRDGSRCVTCGGDQAVRIWDTKAGSLLHTLEGHAAQSVAFAPDGRTAISASADHVLKIWDTASGECRKTLSEAKLGATPVAALPDSRHAVCGYGANGLAVIDLGSGAILRKVAGQGHQVASVAIPAGGHHAITGSEDSILRVWDIEKGEHLFAIPTPYPIWNVSVSGDASLVLAGHRCGYLSLWRLIWTLEFSS